MPLLANHQAPTTPNTPQVTPRASANPFRQCARTIIHAGIAAIIMNALGPLIGQRPLGVTINNLLQAGGYAPFSVGIAAGLNNDRIIAILLAACLVIDGYPNTLLQHLIPAMIGLILGTTVRNALVETTNG